MPKTSKKCKFRGTPAWKKETNGGEKSTSATEPTIDGGTCSQEDYSEEQLIPMKTTASEQKLGSGSSTASHYEENAYSYRFVELSSLMRTFEEFHKCKGGKIVFNEDQAKRYGNSSLIYLECTKCKKRASLQTVGTSNKQWQASNAMDVNRRIVYSACEMGVGREAIAVMCEIFNMPPPCSTPSWDKHQEALYAAHLKAVATRLEAARQEVHDLHCQRNPDTTEDIIDVTVSFDGTWSKRGFTAPFGIGFAISAETGQVLDYDFASKLCLPCSRNKKNLSEEVFKTWYATHKPYCTENHTGSSGSMEREIAKKIWARTESYHMRFKYMICDGDSKAYQSVWNMYGCCDVCEKYENIDRKNSEYKKWISSEDHKEWKNKHDFGQADCNRVMKLDCVGHVQKRVGTTLRELRKKTSGKLKDGLPVGGRKHRLTDKAIDKLQQYYGRAIRKNTQPEELIPEEADKVIKQMQNDIKAVLFHSCCIESNDERHKYCPPGKDSWCKYKRTGTFENNDHHLAAVFLEFLMPVFDRLSDQSLLRRCLPGLSQNRNESLNSLVWVRAPKHKFFGPERVDMAAIGAILQFNDGASSKHLVMANAGIGAGQHSRHRSAQKDARRVSDAISKATAVLKQRRAKIRVAKKQANEEAANAEGGPSYLSGGFNDIDPLATMSSDEEDMQPLSRLLRVQGSDDEDNLPLSAFQNKRQRTQ